METLCRTTLNYVPATVGGRGGGSTEVDVHDGRRADLPGWETCGFELIRHPSAVTDWDDDDQIVSTHYQEIRHLAQQMTGCDRALVNGHIKRNPQKAAQHHDLQPITLVHSDFADSYVKVLEARLGDDGDLVADASRVVILQFWRNVGPARMDMPLAFCDARGVPREQIRAFPVKNYAGGGIDFEALAVVAPSDPADHDWYAFLDMTPDEAVAFRTYDSDRAADGRPFWTPHSAFRDPSVPVGQPARSSIELRATCLFT